MPFILKHPGIRGIAKQEGGQNNEHGPKVMHLPAVVAAHQRMAKFVHDLDSDHDHPEPNQIVQCQEITVDLGASLPPILKHQHQRHAHQQRQQDRSGPAPEPPNPLFHLEQQQVGIEQ